MTVASPMARRALVGALIASAVSTATAQDTTRTRADTSQTLEGVTITAIRGGTAAPISAKTLELSNIEQRHHGQDIPLLLSGTPSLTIKSETGTPWGYSYIRLRGMEQQRINFTLDGIPLNDPEDHVLYFADFPDLGNSVQSVQIQRGVGTSSTGVSAYAGSVNLETINLASAPRELEVQMQAGSFNSRRASVEYASGLRENGFAWYGRASGLRTNGYRRHAGISAWSGFLGGGWFGERDIVKFTATAGVFEDTMAYTGATLDQIAQDRRFNPLRPDERDKFGEQVAALTYIRSLAPNSSLSTTLYRISAGGDFDVCIDLCDQPVATLWKFDLDFIWYGLTSAWSYTADRWRLNLGVNGNTYARDHHAYQRPDVDTPLYFNTGHKRDASGFAKLAYDAGRLTLFGDVQARYARFRYEPDVNAGIPESSIDWTFLNPKVGATWRVNDGVSLYASYGVNSREPARSDMLAGLDNLDTSTADFVGSFDRVKPERAHDLELGVTWDGPRASLQANVFDMRFRNEILPIGELSVIGTPLRENVRSSYRRGVELDGLFRLTNTLSASANATLMTSRIREYTDRNGITYRDVPALLTPTFQTMHRLAWRPVPSLELMLEGRYIGESQLTNTDDPTLVLPSSYVVDGTLTWRFGNGHSLTVYGQNLNDSDRYSTGNVSSSGTPRYFVLAPRNLQVVLRAVY
ncbi:MAG TPA: TonB-dependent receptor [Gemmatimonadaceae bacterium]